MIVRTVEVALVVVVIVIVRGWIREGKDQDEEEHYAEEYAKPHSPRVSSAVCVELSLMMISTRKDALLLLSPLTTTIVASGRCI